MPGFFIFLVDLHRWNSSAEQILYSNLAPAPVSGTVVRGASLSAVLP